MRRVLITGATGALAQAVIEHLRGSPYFQIFATTSRDNPQVDPDVVLLKCNFLNIAELTEAFYEVEPDLILHLGASFTASTLEMYHSNVAPAAALLELTLNREKRTRIVLAGSAAEYGMVAAEANPIDETHVLSPVSMYGMSKAWQTQIMRLYAERGVDVVCARIFNLYGPGISENLFAGRVQNQIDEIKAGLRTVIEVGALGAIRDYLPTSEAAQQLLTIANYGLSGQVYHVGSGIPVTMYDLLMRQLKLNQIDPGLVRESTQHYKKQGYDIPIIFANMEKTQRLQQQEEKCLNLN